MAWTTTVQAPFYVVKASWDTRTLHDSQDSYRRTRIEAPGSEMTWGWEGETGEGREGCQKVSAAAAGRQWKEEEDDTERGTMRKEGSN